MKLDVLQQYNWSLNKYEKYESMPKVKVLPLKAHHQRKKPKRPPSSIVMESSETPVQDMSNEIGSESPPTPFERVDFQSNSHGDINTNTLPWLWEKTQPCVGYQQDYNNQNESAFQLISYPAEFLDGAREMPYLQDGAEYTVDSLVDWLEDWKISSASTEPRLVAVTLPPASHKRRSKREAKIGSKPRASN